MLREKAEEIYEKIKDGLKGQEGKIVAIDLASGDYFVGDSVVEAVEKGRQKYPGREFFLKRVGAKHTFVVGAV